MKYCLITFTYDQGVGTRNRFGMESIPCTYTGQPTDREIELMGKSRIDFGARCVTGYILTEIRENEFLKYPEILRHSFV